MSDLTPRVNAIEEQSAKHEAGGIWKIGDIKHSFLTPVQFQAEHDNTWELCEGQSISGSDLATVTGWTNAPDARGVFLRGVNNGIGVGTGNPSGEVAPGTYQADGLGSHNHTYPGSDGSGGGSGIEGVGYGLGRNDNTYTWPTHYSGTSETRPRNVSCNMYIKINREPTI